MGPFHLLYAALIGFFAFSAVYHLILWSTSRRDTLLAIFSFDCLVRAGLCLALVALITSTTPEEAFTAMRARVALVLLTLITSLWSVRQISGVRADRFITVMTVLLGAIFVVQAFIVPLNTPVLVIKPMILPWGEAISSPQSAAPRWWVAPMLVLGFLVQFFAIYCGLRVWKRDRVAGIIIQLVTLGTLVIFILESLRAYRIFTAPILGAFPHVLWVCLIAMLIARGHRQIRDQLVASQQRYRGIFDQTFQFIGLISTEGRLIEANRSSLEFAGIRESDVIGQMFWDTPWWSHSPEQQARLQAAVKEAATGRTVRFEVTHHRADGRLARIDFSLKPVRDAQGRVTLLIPEGRDISDLKGAEETIRQILETVAPTTGRDFLITLANHLCNVCQVDHAFIGALDPDEHHTVRGIAFSHGGKSGDSFSYNLVDTPCENVMTLGFCHFSTGVQQSFPRDLYLQQLQIDSYMGVPLKSSQGVSIGLIAVLHGRQMRDPEQTETLLRVVAARAGAELERELAEAARRETESRHRVILESSLDGVILIDSAGVILEFNPAAEQLFRLPRDQALGRKLSDCIIPAELRSSYEKRLQACAAGDASSLLGRRVEMAGIRSDGTAVECELTIAQIPGRTGPLFSGIVRDITDRKLAERSLRSSQQRLSAVIANSPGVAVQWYDRAGRVLLWNRASEEMYGYTESEALGKTLDQLFLSTREQGEFLARLERIRESGQPGEAVESTFRRRGGERGDCLSTTFAIPGEDTDQWFVRMDVDITQRKLTERALQDRETFLRLAQEAAHVGSWEWSTLTNRFKWSDELARMHGIEVSEFDGTLESVLSFCAAEDRETVREALSSLLTRPDTGAIEYSITPRHGVPRDLWILGQVTQYQDGKPSKVLGVAIEVTDRNRELTRRRHLEAQLAQSQKMEAVGRLAGGIAHDFNNLLTVINGYTELLLAMVSGTDEKSPMLAGIQAAGQRAAALTRQLLTFSRKQVVEPRSINLNEVVAETDQMLRRLIGENIQLVTDIGPQLLPVLADPGQIGQVIVNLAVNARDAMASGGRLTLQTRLQHVDTLPTAHQPAAQPGDYAVLSVSDTGCGMTPDVQARVFEPFFTTKAAGQGTGLGLATVRTVIEQTSGFVTVTSTPGAGSTFEVFLPLLREDAQRSPADSGEIPTPEGHESILLVEDEEAVRALTRRLLEQFGYTVIEATGGPEALRLVQQRVEPIDLVITDVVMPEMGGQELAAQLLRLQPGLRILYLSGYTDDAIIGLGTADHEVAFLQKPFTVDGLAAKVRQTLGAQLHP